MAFEGLKDRSKELWADWSAKIQESSTFNSIREKFEEQTPAAQKAIVIGGSVLVVLLVLSLPYSFISQSQDNMTLFEDNRSLIQGLLHASRAAKEPSPLPPGMNSDQLRARVNAILSENQLVPEQIGEIAPLPGRPAGDLAPAGVIQSGLVVQIKKLNLRQVIALGVSLQNIGVGTKLLGMDVVQSPGQTHYYDMIARMVNFSLPVMTFENEPEKKDKKSAKRPEKPADGDGVE